MIEDSSAGFAQLEEIEHLATSVTIAVPVEEHPSVTESSVCAGVASGDEAVDRNRVSCENFIHLNHPSFGFP